MMLDIDFSELRAGFARYLPFSLRLAAVLGAELIFAVGAWNAGLIEPAARAAVPSPHMSNTEALGSVIYTRYAYVFEAAGLVLLVRSDARRVGQEVVSKSQYRWAPVFSHTNNLF